MFRVQVTDVPPVDRRLEAIGRLPCGPQLVAPLRHGRRRAGTGAKLAEITGAVGLLTRRRLDLVVERYAAGESEGDVSRAAEMQPRGVQNVVSGKINAAHFERPGIDAGGNNLPRVASIARGQ